MEQCPETARDTFHFLAQINKASLVALVEGGIIAKPAAYRIARALDQVMQMQSGLGKRRLTDYLALEQLLIAEGGVEVTLVHSGRSRQDISATIERLAMREAFLSAARQLNDARAELLVLADRYAASIVPAYTWGVQAQPTTFGHVLLAFASALARTAERAAEAYLRLNRSPLGSAALATSGFNLDRNRLAELLGTEGPVVNSYDAVQLAPMDTVADVAAVATSAALTVGALATDWITQYSQAHPWITLKRGELTGVSSIMPQKRNPKGLVMLRAQAGTVIGLAQTTTLLAHNVQAGMSDYKGFIVDPANGGTPMALLRELEALFAKLKSILATIGLDAERAAQEVDADYSVTTELADVLQKVHGVPFRAGHHFASEIVNHGRQHRLPPSRFPYHVAKQVFAEVAAELGLGVSAFPLTEDEFRKALSARAMIDSRVGLGGPQPKEVARLLEKERAILTRDTWWMTHAAGQVHEAEVRLNASFREILDGLT